MAAGKTRSGAMAAVFLVLIAVGFVAAVMFVNNAFKSNRIDLTDDGLFTLSEGTRNVIQSIDEPITVSKLADALSLKAAILIKKCFQSGLGMFTQNQNIG